METIIRKAKTTDTEIPLQKKIMPTTTNRADLIPGTRLQDLDIENFSIPIPAGETLLRFQDPAIRRMLWFMKHEGQKGVYNAYDPGLGKTMMAIVSMANVLQSKKILVVVPSGLLGNWGEQIRKWDTENGTTPVTIQQIYKSRAAMRPITAKWCIVSYRLLLSENVFRRLDDTEFDCMICDEAKELKNPQSKRTILAMHLWNNVRRGLLMDGTPMTKSARDMFVPCHVMRPEEYPSEDDFCDRYCLKKTVPWGFQGWEYFGGKNLEELSAAIRSKFFVRKVKEEVIEDLPDTTYTKIALDCGKFDKKLTEEQERAILRAVDEGRDPNECAKPQDKQHIAERRLEAGLRTLGKGKDIIQNFLDGDVPVMVIAYHRAVIDGIMEVFKDHHPVKIDGSVTGPKKDIARHAFNSGETNLIVLQIKSAVGIDLHHRCSNAVYVELSYDPTQIRQSLDRLRRIGQKSAINAYFLVAEGSVDEQVFEVLKKKLKFIDQVVQSTDE